MCYLSWSYFDLSVFDYFCFKMMFLIFDQILPEKITPDVACTDD
jgi:hypothetical protein